MTIYIVQDNSTDDILSYIFITIIKFRKERCRNASLEKCFMVVFSFFSGVGMLDLGFQNAGFEIVFVNECEREFLRSYKYSRRKEGFAEPRVGYFNCDINAFFEEPLCGLLERSISELRNNNEIIGFIGGPPCPDFSVGGKNRGKNGENGKLAKSYIDLIIKFKPDLFLFENVKGLLLTKRHREYYEELKQNLIDNNYVLSDTLVNSLEYGVPQDRERVLLIGINGCSELSKKVIFVNNYFAFPWKRHCRFNAEAVKNSEWPTTQKYIQYSKRKFKYKSPIELTVEYWFIKNNVYKHPNRLDKFKVRKAQDKIVIIDEGDVSRKSYKRLHRWRYSPTAAYGNNEVHLHPYRNRRISVAEAMAIQSLPSTFELPRDLALTAKFKMIGNGVPYLMSYEIARTIREYLGL